ncbi:MAG: hypothetical protein JSW71_18410 [Gemmatimonadota bacterium]|nr:MAG: hypothetical protein JSW71_18410 [Gemmatimonadota bacterium]
MIRNILRGVVLAIGTPAAALTQESERQEPPVIDTIVVITQDVYGSEESSNFLTRIANAVHFKTRPSVVHRELLFTAGTAYDSALVAETERNLRGLGLFREVRIDTVRLAGRLAAVVRTADGWTTELQLNARFTAGTFSWGLGLIERNFLGAATVAGVTYRDEPDRTAFTIRGATERAFGSRIAVRGLYDKLSDGTRGVWGMGIPYRAFVDRSSLGYDGYAGDERVLQYRDGVARDTLQRRSFIQVGRLSTAPVAKTGEYLRLGVAGQFKSEAYLSARDTGTVVPDTMTAVIGGFAEWARARFRVVTHYNGFARDFDLDLSTRILLSTWVAPSAFGYERTGLGAAVSLQTGVSLGPNFALLEGQANGLFTSTGLDSGRVWVGLTMAARPFPRNATVLHLEVGAYENTPPGTEFDLGHGTGPRLFGPHSFTGTRAVWVALEHRSFLIDEILGLVGVGVAGFVDYGGAWYSDQSSRLGGNFGVGLRIGATRATGPNVGRIDFGYRFGEGTEGKRWALSFGQGFTF